MLLTGFWHCFLLQRLSLLPRDFIISHLRFFFWYWYAISPGSWFSFHSLCICIKGQRCRLSAYHSKISSLRNNVIEHKSVATRHSLLVREELFRYNCYLMMKMGFLRVIILKIFYYYILLPLLFYILVDYLLIEIEPGAWLSHQVAGIPTYTLLIFYFKFHEQRQSLKQLAHGYISFDSTFHHHSLCIKWSAYCNGYILSYYGSFKGNGVSKSPHHR